MTINDTNVGLYKVDIATHEPAVNPSYYLYAVSTSLSAQYSQGSYWYNDNYNNLTFYIGFKDPATDAFANLESFCQGVVCNVGLAANQTNYVYVFNPTPYNETFVLTYKRAARLAFGVAALVLVLSPVL